MQRKNRENLYTDATKDQIIFAKPQEKCTFAIQNEQLHIEMNTDDIIERVERLRSWMIAHGLHAFIFPSSDPHMGEYVPDHWKTREWISGFNGSAGTAVVTLHSAALWTDSRYWLAAEEQLAGTPFSIVRCRRNVATAEELAEWIASDLTKDEAPVVGLDAWCNSEATVNEMQTQLSFRGIALRSDLEPATELWEHRPELPLAPIEVQPIEFAGCTTAEKLADIRKALRRKGADALVVSQLDEIAWTLNLRGMDVHCTPLFVAYMFITPNDVFLCTDERKITPTVRDYLKVNDITLRPYGACALSPNLVVQFDPEQTNAALVAAIKTKAGESFAFVHAASPITPLKAIKNETEILCFRRSMLRDGVAMVKFLRWLKPAVEQGEVTECSAAERLRELRAEQPLFRDISFDTIAGYGQHAAVVHYEPTPETDIALEPHGLLLLDSGAQYQDGTTDITRTIALGPLTDAERRDYTLVLRGFLRLSMARFPEGTTGTQLDVLARYAMWQDGKNYGHGTGHGVGSYLSVHEGPHQFRMNWMPSPLQAGMTVTVEPGIYIAGSHGARTENTMLIVADGENDFGKWLRLDPLTLCPIDTTPIVVEMLQPDELAYLNDYHARVCETLMPLLTDDAERQWLFDHTRPIE